LLSDFFSSSKMVGELNVREGLAGFSFVGSEVLCRRLGDGVQGHGDILVVSDLLQMDV